MNKQKPPVTQPAQGEKIQVSASFYPLFFFAKEIGKDKADVRNITPSGVEPHDYDPTAQDIVNIQKSKILIVNGAGFEPWLEKIKNDLGGVIIVNTTEGVNLHKGKDEHHGKEHKEESKKKHEELSYDPHVWLSPVLAKSQVDKILQAYIQVDPDNKAYYESNAKSLKEKLDRLDRKFKQGLASCEKKSFVTSHAAFGYLAAEYNLTQVPISGLSPDEEPSPRDMARITEFVRDNNIKFIFFETLVSPKLSETIANEAGAETLVLDPIEGLSENNIKQGKNYFTIMDSNLQNLRKALECK
jgi:zinc transport system substrate-binding protein